MIFMKYLSSTNISTSILLINVLLYVFDIALCNSLVVWITLETMLLITLSIPLLFSGWFENILSSFGIVVSAPTFLLFEVVPGGWDGNKLSINIYVYIHPAPFVRDAIFPHCMLVHVTTVAQEKRLAGQKGWTVGSNVTGTWKRWGKGGTTTKTEADYWRGCVTLPPTGVPAQC